jgi:hypothetical protein
VRSEARPVPENRTARPADPAKLTLGSVLAASRTVNNCLETFPPPPRRHSPKFPREQTEERAGPMPKVVSRAWELPDGSCSAGLQTGGRLRNGLLAEVLANGCPVVQSASNLSASESGTVANSVLCAAKSHASLLADHPRDGSPWAQSRACE